MDADRAKLKSFDPDVSHAIAGEERRQLDGVEMIPSENYTYPEVLAALGSVLTNKYSEGYPGRRYYGGQQYRRGREYRARPRLRAVSRRARQRPAAFRLADEPGVLFRLPQSRRQGAGDGPVARRSPDAWSPGFPHGQGLQLRALQDRAAAGGHELMDIAKATRPKLVLCGYSSYPRDYDYAAFKKVADEVGALTMADISHIGGLVAANVMRNPFDSGFDVVTTTTHKTLRGARGGLILSRRPTRRRSTARFFRVSRAARI
jgi:glycine hydroxymethyltransferase